MRGLHTGQCRVERSAGAHDGFQLLEVGHVIPTNVNRLALHAVQLFHNLLLVVRKALGQGRKLRGQLGVIGLRGQRLRPVQSQVKLTATVIKLACLGRWVFVGIQQFTCRCIQGLGQYGRLGVVSAQTHVFKAHRQRHELTE